MASTYEKMHALAAELREQSLNDTSPEARGSVELIQMSAGLGFDLLGYLIPDSPADADVMVDQLLALFLSVRGDDLPPFDVNLYGEAPAVEPLAAVEPAAGDDEAAAE